MFTIKQDFPHGTKVFEIPLEWFRKVAEFLNSLTGNAGIIVRKPARPGGSAPVEIAIDEQWLDKWLGKAATPDDTNVDNTQTGDGDVEGIASATDTTAYQTGDTLAQTAARVLPLAPGGGSWTAGGAGGLRQYEISRIAPFQFGASAVYAKIFVRLVTRNHSGLVVSTGDEVDQNIIIRLY